MAGRLHLDTFSGIAGNMFLAALLDLGLPRKALKEGLAPLALPHTLRVSKVRRGALAARYVTVGVPRGSQHGHRHYSHIRKLLDAAGLDPAVRDLAQEIFAALAVAEAKVHGIPVEKVHFHEVGAVDAIVDIVGAAIAVTTLAPSQITATPVALGHGRVETQHGRLPLPAPATLELLRGVPTVPAEVAWETVTPTGAAILRTIVDEYRTLPAMTVARIGHGAGNDREGPMPNVLRAVLGSESVLAADRVVALETNLDDVVPEHFDHLLERLLAEGALDVSIQHVQMKKNRPGFLVRVLCRPSERLRLAGLLFDETPTLGVRSVDYDRLLLERESRRVETPYGRIRVKISRRPDGRQDVSAEYDDCKRAAGRAGAPLRDVVRAAEQVARDALD